MEAFVESIEVKILVFVELLEFEIGILVVLLEVEIGVFVKLFVGRKLFDRVEGGDCTAFSSSNFLEFLVFLLKGNSPNITIRSEMKSGKLIPLKELDDFKNDMENWSKIVLDHLNVIFGEKRKNNQKTFQLLFLVHPYLRKFPLYNLLMAQ